MIFVVLPEVEILDLAGPLQAFSEANAARPRYRIRVCATRPRIAKVSDVKEELLVSAT